MVYHPDSTELEARPDADTVKTLAAGLGVTPPYARRLLQRGCPSNLAGALRWRVANRQRGELGARRKG
jgi:hypothetical protein